MTQKFSVKGILRGLVQDMQARARDGTTRNGTTNNTGTNGQVSLFLCSTCHKDTIIKIMKSLDIFFIIYVPVDLTGPEIFSFLAAQTTCH